MKRFVLIMNLIVCLSIVSNAQESTRWRGLNSSGIYTVEKLLPQWPAEGPKVIWSFDHLGAGYSSPVFANNKIYVCGMIEGQSVLFVLDQNGRELQHFKYGKEFTDSYPGVRSTPTIDGELAYLLTGNGELTCLDLKTGTPVWKKDFTTQMDGENIQWGYTESLLVDGDVLYCTPGGKMNPDIFS